ncbi:MAG: hypothetical protein MZV63_33210 [Marinilabiliales bacterium]|nr:hypothetical protein [Marinilabiliales bacterium]
MCWQGSATETERIGNVFELVDKLAAGAQSGTWYSISQKGCTVTDVSLSSLRLLDQYRIPYVFSGPVVMGISSINTMPRLVAEAAGVPVSPGILVSIS